MQPLSWREKFAATLVLLIGIVFLTIQISSLLSSKGNRYAEVNGSFVISKGELFADIRTYFTVLLGILGGVLLWRNKRLGWVIGVSLLIFFIVIAGLMLIPFVTEKIFDNNFKMITGFAILLLTAVIFLLLPSARQKYRVGKKTYLPTLLFFMAITAIYFFLQ